MTNMTNDKNEKLEKEIEMKRRQQQTWISKLTKEQMAEIEESFRFFDRDSSGSIDTGELADAMKSLGVGANEAELTRMIEEVDIDGNGAIDFDEFLGMMARKMVKGDEDDDGLVLLESADPNNKFSKPRENLFQRAFKIFDADGDGFITSKDLHALMGIIGECWTADEIEDMIRVADSDGDGRVNYNDFLRVVDTSSLQQQQKTNKTGVTNGK